MTVTAGIVNPALAPWPVGKDSLYLIQLGPCYQAADSGGDKIAQRKLVPFDCTIVKALMSVGWSAQTTGTEMSITDDGTAGDIVTHVAELAIVSATHDGKTTALTVAVPALKANQEVHLLLDTNNAADLIGNITVELWVRPTYTNPGMRA